MADLGWRMADWKSPLGERAPLSFRTHPPCGSIRHSAFTLVEVMVVVVIIGVLAGMAVVSMGASSGAAGLRASAAQLKHAAEYAHGYAATRGVACRLVFDTEGGRFFLEREKDALAEPGQYEVMTEEGMRPVTLPTGVTFGEVRIEAAGAGGAGGATQAKVVTFRPTGEADAAAVEVTAGERTWTLRIAPATGRCELLEGKATEMLTDRMDLDV
jgi:type II secretion system protein H